MPYTKGTSERTREQQVERPMELGELALALTVELLNYIKNQGESFKIYTHVLNAISPHNTVSPRDYREPKNAAQIAAKIRNILDLFKAHHNYIIDTDEVRGVQIAVLQEMYWRMVRPYEDLKCTENGDVFPKSNFTELLVREILKKIQSIKKPGRPKKEEVE